MIVNLEKKRVFWGNQHSTNISNIDASGMRFLLLLASPERGSSGPAVAVAVAAVALADVFVELTAGAVISHLAGGWRG